MTGLGSSCGACKFLRRKCTSECVFAPYFYYEQAATHFAAVHKVFGASNVSKLLSHLPVQNRSDAALTICYEAMARVQDPTYGCVAHIIALQQQIASLQEEIEILGNHMANFTVGIASDGSPETTLNSNHEMQIPSLEDAMNTQNYKSQLGAPVNNSGYTTENQAFQEEIEILGNHMANFTVGIASDGSPETTLNSNHEMQIPSLGDAMNTQNYQSQLGAPVNNSGYTTENQAFDSQMNVQLSPLYEWEDQNPFCDFQPNPLEILLEGVDQEIFPYCPWLDSGNNAN